MPRAPRPDIVLGRLTLLAFEKRKLQGQVERKERELVEACRQARASKTLEQIAEATGYSRAWAGKITGRRKDLRGAR